MGDTLGSSFVGASLSTGIGPLLFPAVLSTGIERCSLVAAAIDAATTVLLIRADELSGWLESDGDAFGD